MDELLQDRLFVVNDCGREVTGEALTAPGFSVSEYRCQKRALVLIKVNDIHFSEFEFPPECLERTANIEIYSCTVVEYRFITYPDARRQVARVYDLSTAWQAGMTFHPSQERVIYLVLVIRSAELQWDAVP